MRVALFVTGDMEQAALADALSRVFPAHDFECVPLTPPNRPFTSFTSSRLPIEREVSEGVRSHIDKLVQRAERTILGRRERAPDLLVIVDDLELANLDQPEVVVTSVRTAVSAHLDQLGPSLRERAARAFRGRVSLHFAVPMIESWLFADPRGPSRAGAPPERGAPSLSCRPRFEDFTTDDAEYLADDCEWCTRWASLAEHRRRKKATRSAHQPEWCRGDPGDRHRHPKRYLAWLCRSADAKKCSTYRETSGDRSGAEALRQLDWEAVTRNGELPFLNAMLDDLAEGLGEPSPLDDDAPLAPQTRRRDERGTLLRNI